MSLIVRHYGSLSLSIVLSVKVPWKKADDCNVNYAENGHRYVQADSEQQLQ